jgi:hypothetical protein
MHASLWMIHSVHFVEQLPSAMVIEPSRYSTSDAYDDEQELRNTGDERQRRAGPRHPWRSHASPLAPARGVNGFKAKTS